MEHSIDLGYLKQISFGDPQLLADMVDEWIEDTRDRLNKLEDKLLMSDPKIAYTQVHNLKTSFFMIGHASMIRLCEKYLQNNLSDYQIIAHEGDSALNYIQVKILPSLRH
ncbi:MAG: hypothetical protein K1X68_03015 [Saprospiraceae bacterium]|nr:hypothetical protein [Saprospiraceae bacterium]HMW38197.1 hypothetical protein [Saprospiraceae bacterium]HMX87392.1 hypothetical protein [Saprospiraceae bacterium]HMZ39219.1 hypothetical protein [Saprospiraceae bacterium]HNA63482.1 hypothetical protein [Saprospiraceae bacterium]